MVIYVGIDDTDSMKGMCTTYLASELIQEFEDFDIIGYPRLVRLNPNIPWKTRGNGAICLAFGEGFGRKVQVAKVDSKKYFGYEKGRSKGLDEAFLGRVRRIVERNAMFEDEHTNPAFVVLERKPPPSLYWKAVRGIVDLEEAKSIVEGDGYHKAYKNGRGLIGALSAVSWRPRDRTFEIMTYREKARWGTEREIDEESVIEMDKRFKSTFNNYDYVNGRIVIAPNSPCPVLFGIRGEDWNILEEAMKTVRSEPIDRWVIFETNQGTDDHIQCSSISKMEPYKSVVVRGKVCIEPRTIAGGHVIFTISNDGSIDCTAYEPSKQFRHVIWQLRKGDVVSVYGAVRSEPRTLNIEKIKIERLSRLFQKVANPLCPHCEKRMKSAGMKEGYRCRRCGNRANQDAVEKVEVARKIKEGFYEPPVCARRHISKPIKRIEGAYPSE